MLSLSENYVVDHLKHDAESILTAIKIDSTNNITLNSKQIEPVYSRPYSGQYFQIIANNSIIRSRSLWDQQLLIPEVGAGEQKRIYLQGPDKQPLIVIVHGFYKQGLNYTIAVAEDLSPTLDSQQAFQYRYSYTVGILLFLLIACQFVLLRLNFQPFKNIQKQITQLRQGELEHLDTKVPEEAKDLVKEINHLLTVIENRLQRSRNALGDLAHSLKIPLTVIQHITENEALKSQPEICQSLQKQTNNMQGIMQRVLKQARFSGDGIAISKFNARKEVPDLINVLQSIYQDKGISIQFTMNGQDTVVIDREDMMELMGNLLDNACKWAKSSVGISINNIQDLHILIEDDGPGISEQKMAQLLERGKRLDEMKEGHGLGLSIVNYMVQQHGGELKLSRSSRLGGLSVEIKI